METRRNTIQRQLTLAAVRELNCHATAEQVHEYVVTKYPSISKGTVYRNLSHMVETGELLRIGNFNGSYHYDHNCHNHYHFICDTCGRVFDIEDYFVNLCSQIRNTDGFEITSHSITFGGLCADCNVHFA